MQPWSGAQSAFLGACAPVSSHDQDNILTLGEQLLPSLAQTRDGIRRFISAAGEVWFGMTAYEFVISARRQRAYLERIFVLSLFGDLLGVPVMPPYYSLRLLPFIVPSINRWRHSMLRERDLADMVGGGESLG